MKMCFRIKKILSDRKHCHCHRVNWSKGKRLSAEDKKHSDLSVKQQGNNSRHSRCCESSYAHFMNSLGMILFYRLHLLALIATLVFQRRRQPIVHSWWLLTHFFDTSSIDHYYFYHSLRFHWPHRSLALELNATSMESRRYMREKVELFQNVLCFDSFHFLAACCYTSWLLTLSIRFAHARTYADTIRRSNVSEKIQLRSIG